jgi:FimV-like protein
MAKPGSKSKDTIDSLKERMGRDPLSRAFLQLAEEYRKTGQYADAIHVCQEGLARHPAYHTARISLGRTYLESGDLENARRALSEVLELAPENHLAGKLLAEVQRRMGDVEGAAETYRAILRHYPGDREIEALARDLQGAGDQAPGADARRASPPAAASPAAAPAEPARARGVETARTVVEAGARPATASRPSPEPRPQAAAAIEPTFEYGPEDVRPSSRVMAGPAATGVPEPEGRGDALQTNTLAELYLRQGLVEKALEVYRAMVRVDPSNERVRRRLEELSPPGAGAPRTAGAGTKAADPPLPAAPVRPVTAPIVVAPAGIERHGAAVKEASIVGEPGPRAAIATHRKASIDRLDRWLRRVRAGAGPTAGAEPR